MEVRVPWLRQGMQGGTLSKMSPASRETSVAVPAKTKHTAVLYLHPSLQCMAVADSAGGSYQLMRAVDPIPHGAVLLVEHVAYGSPDHIFAVLKTDPAFFAQLHPRSGDESSSAAEGLPRRPPADPKAFAAAAQAKLEANAFVGADGSLRLGPVVTRFNHSCEPQCVVRYVYEETPRTYSPFPNSADALRRDGFAIIYAVADIPAGSEVCYQYNAGAHDQFACTCTKTLLEREHTEYANNHQVAPPIVEANRSFLESTIAHFLDTREATCSFCGQPATSICKGCEAVAFCNASCLKADWPAHKVICKTARAVRLKT